MDDDQHEPAPPAGDGHDIKNLRAKAAKADELEARLAALQEQLVAKDRQALFDKVGVPAEKLGKLFRTSYDGDLTEEAVKAAALENGLIEEQRTTPVEERAVLDRIQDQLAGASPESGFSEDIDRALQERINAASSNDEIDRILKDAGMFIYDS